MRAWQSPYEIIGDSCDADGHQYPPLDRLILRELLGSPLNNLDYLFIAVYVVVCCFLSCVWFGEERLKEATVNRSERPKKLFGYFIDNQRSTIFSCKWIDGYVDIDLR